MQLQDRRADSTSRGPEQVFRFTLKKPVANFGAVVVTRARGVRVSPRLVVAGDENRLVGYTALPSNSTRTSDYGRVEPGRRRGLARCRRVRLRLRHAGRRQAGQVHVPLLGERHDAAGDPRCCRAVARGALRLAVTDTGSGVDPASIVAEGRRHACGLHVRARTSSRSADVAPGRHAVTARRLRLPGGEEHGERRADPAEHADVLERPSSSGSARASGGTRPRSSAGSRGRARRSRRSRRHRCSGRRAATPSASRGRAGGGPRRRRACPGAHRAAATRHRSRPRRPVRAGRCTASSRPRSYRRAKPIGPLGRYDPA